MLKDSNKAINYGEKLRIHTVLAQSFMLNLGIYNRLTSALYKVKMFSFSPKINSGAAMEWSKLGFTLQFGVFK